LLLLLLTLSCLSQVNFPRESSSPSELTRSSLEKTECCFPAAICSSALLSQKELAAASCLLPGGERGLCCPDGRTPSRGSTRRPFATIQNTNSGTVSGTVSANELTVAVRRGKLTVENITRATANFGVPVRNSAAFFHARFQSQSEDEIFEIGRSGLLLPEIALELVGNDISTRQFGGNGGRRDSSAVNFGDSVSGRQIVGDASCPSDSRINCRGGNQAYRTPDGSCNNLQQPTWGKSKTALNRLMLPAYADGIQAPRISVTGQELPSARLVSTRLARDLDNPDSNYAVMVMPFGQFVDHDLDHAPIIKSSDGQDIDCCSPNSVGDFSSVCYPIQVSSDDPFFRGDKSCINLVRSTPAPALDCSVRYREQLNQVATNRYCIT
jgi:peroxidase